MVVDVAEGDDVRRQVAFLRRGGRRVDFARLGGGPDGVDSQQFVEIGGATAGDADDGYVEFFARRLPDDRRRGGPRQRGAAQADAPVKAVCCRTSGESVRSMLMLLMQVAGSGGETFGFLL